MNFLQDLLGVFSRERTSKPKDNDMILLGRLQKSRFNKPKLESQYLTFKDLTLNMLDWYVKNRSYQDDLAAQAGGLSIGEWYYNTTDKTLKRI